MASASSSPNKKRPGGVGRFFAAFFKILGTLLLIGILTGSIMACFAATYIKTVILPDSHMDLTAYDTRLSSTIYYTDKATGQPVPLQTLYSSENRIWVTYDQIPEHLIDAVVAIEDRRFWTHNGVDWKRTAYGVLSMLTGRDIQGGSTITQQLIKNITQENDVTVKRKIQEIFRALDVESNYDKEQILEYYLNYIFLGSKCYGVSTAANYYFSKDVSDLDLAESVVLISITNNPSLYNPYLHPENNQKRATLVLSEMLKQGKISQSEHDAAKARIADVSSMLVRGENNTQTDEIYPWYVEQVISDVIRDLGTTYNLSEKAAIDRLYYGGLSIYCNLDPDIQAVVDSVYSTQESMPLVSDSGQKLQSAIAIVDTEGRIVALAGAMGEKTGNRVYNIARDAHRQPGSSIKMLSTYAPALDMGLITPYSVFDDSPVQEVGGKAWPSNAYLRYYGRMTVFDAVEESANTVAARVLQQVTPEASIDFLRTRFGISDNSLVLSGDKNDYGLSQLALGGMTRGVSPLEMAAAYSAFPRNGIYLSPKSYSTVEDANGAVVLDHSNEQPVNAVKDTTAWYVNTMLKNVVTGARGTGREAALSNMTVAGKTGSTNSNNDKWFVGYTPYYTAAVWTGYDTPERIRTNGGYNPAVRLWAKVMGQIHEGLENRDFDAPSATPVAINYCMDSGLIPTSACSMDSRGGRVATGYVFPEDKPGQSCDLHKVVEFCISSAITGADGEAVTNLYHKAGEFCPREAVEGTDIVPTVHTFSLLDYHRERVNGERVAQDEHYLLENWAGYGPCTIHTSPIVVPPKEYDPTLFDINDQTTWPTEEQWPGFDPLDPTTWPGAIPETPSPTPSDGPVEPSPEPSSGAVTTPDPTPTPFETPSPTPPPVVDTPPPAPTPTPPPVNTPPAETPQEMVQLPPEAE